MKASDSVDIGGKTANLHSVSEIRDFITETPCGRKELCLLGQNVETVVGRGQNQAVFKGCCFTVVKKKKKRSS